MNSSNSQINNVYSSCGDEPCHDTPAGQHLPDSESPQTYNSSSQDFSNGQTTLTTTAENPYQPFGTHVHLFPAQRVDGHLISPIPTNPSTTLAGQPIPWAGLVDRPPTASSSSMAHIMYAYPRTPRVNQDPWTPEQDEVLSRGKHENKKISAIAEELFYKFGVVRTPNVVSKRWAKIKGRCVNENVSTTMGSE